MLMCNRTWIMIALGVTVALLLAACAAPATPQVIRQEVVVTAAVERTAEENKAILRRFFEEVFNDGDLSVADEIFAADYVNRNPAPGENPSLEGLKQFVTAVRGSFPDIHFTIDDQIAEGDKVVTRFTWQGTHQAEFAGIPASGSTLTVSAINIHRVADGKIQEAWFKYDTLDFLQQAGAIPPMEGGGE